MKIKKKPVFFYFTVVTTKYESTQAYGDSTQPETFVLRSKDKNKTVIVLWRGSRPGVLRSFDKFQQVRSTVRRTSGAKYCAFV